MHKEHALLCPLNRLFCSVDVLGQNRVDRDFAQEVEPPLAFQSLAVLRGSGQAMHQAPAYVVVSSPLEFAASWIALEDVELDSGALEYYAGSHKGEEYLFNHGKQKNMPLDYPDPQRYSLAKDLRPNQRQLPVPFGHIPQSHLCRTPML